MHGPYDVTWYHFSTVACRMYDGMISVLVVETRTDEFALWYEIVQVRCSSLHCWSSSSLSSVTDCTGPGPGRHRYWLLYLAALHFGSRCFVLELTECIFIASSCYAHRTAFCMWHHESCRSLVSILLHTVFSRNVRTLTDSWRVIRPFEKWKSFLIMVCRGRSGKNGVVVEAYWLKSNAYVHLGCLTISCAVCLCACATTRLRLTFYCTVGV